ncbi:MAG: hypothetical protein WBB37_00355 [bacterium]
MNNVTNKRNGHRNRLTPDDFVNIVNNVSLVIVVARFIGHCLINPV